MSTRLETTPRLWKARDLELHLGVTDRTLLNWAKRGMPVIRLADGGRRFDLQACMEWIAAQQDHQPAETGEAA